MIKQIRTTIAVALDDSFNFYYEDNLDALRCAGAKIKFFDKTMPKCNGLYLGGGFPEIHFKACKKHKYEKRDQKICRIWQSNIC